MTGYGRQEQLVDGRLICVEVRTVNHRYLEYNARTPRSFAFLEGKLKALVQTYVARGKTDVTITVEHTDREPVRVQVNQTLASGYVCALRELAAAFDLSPEITAVQVAASPEVLTVQREELDEAQLWQAVRQTAQAALEQLVLMREQEGADLKRDLLNRAAQVTCMVERVEARSPQTVEEYRRRLQARLEELKSDEAYNEARLYTELTLFADKVAVAEETVRLRSHLHKLGQTLEEPEAVGRKLDFLAQEMHREANTIGAKAVDSEIAHIVVEMKTEIEKIREQIQNIE